MCVWRSATVSKLAVGFVCVWSVTNNGQHQKLMTRQWQFKLHMRIAHSQIQRYTATDTDAKPMQLAEVNAQCSTMAPTCRVSTYLFAFRSVLRHSLDTHAHGEILGYTGCLFSPHSHKAECIHLRVSVCVALATVIPSVSQLVLVKRQLNVNAQRSSIGIQSSFVGIFVSRFRSLSAMSVSKCISVNVSQI